MFGQRKFVINMLSIASFTFNAFQENTYLLYDSSSAELLIIDPGCYTEEEESRVHDFVQEKSLKPRAILLTHAHIDHVLGLHAMQQTYSIPVYLHPKERSNLVNLPNYAPLFGIRDYKEVEVSESLQKGQSIPIGQTALQVREVPGHAPGHVVFYLSEQKLLIAGDTLFYQGIGRTDLPGGDQRTLIRSIREQIYTLPDEVEVYPGHGPRTQVGYEKQHNPFVRA